MPDDSPTGKYARLEMNNKIDLILGHQEKMAKDLSDIKRAMYEPDEGIYSRIKDIEVWKADLIDRVEEKIEHQTVTNGELRVSQIETSLATHRKIQWMVIGSAISTITALIIKTFVI